MIAVDNDAAVTERPPEYLRHGGQVASKQRFSSAGGRVGLHIATQIDVVHREPVGATEFFQCVDIAERSVPEAEIVADHDGVRARPAVNEFADEFLR